MATKKLIEVALPLEKSMQNRQEKNLSDIATLPRCICGGHENQQQQLEL